MNLVGAGEIQLKRKQCFATCKFDISMIPIRLNLPMVSKPVSWGANQKCLKLQEQPSTFADLKGGYLSGVSGEFYNRFRLLTSHDYDHFYIRLEDPSRLCAVLNKLQSQAFQINRQVLSFILEYRDALEEAGLLMNRYLAKVNLEDAAKLLRACHTEDRSVGKYSKLLNDFAKRVQRARYEEFVLNLACAYDGYQFYLPAFMDFRGRIYRSGVLHFHERDLARSLILFANDKAPTVSSTDESTIRRHLTFAAAFKFKKFQSLKQSGSWYDNTFKELMYENSNQKITIDEFNKRLINLAQKASDPFQFLAKSLSSEQVTKEERSLSWNRIQVTQDASASAYQIMSYLLLNKELGRQTNLLPPEDGRKDELLIQDLYSSMRTELLKFLRDKFELEKYDSDYFPSQIEPYLTRKLVKRLFMPLIYGKTLFTMANDIYEAYEKILTGKELYTLAKYCREFWVTRYPDIANIMKLINLIGWFCSALDEPVIYSIDYLTTVQDYMCSEKAEIWVYDKYNKKRRRITLRVPTLKRDKRKTQVATCVNFIHQRDAFIAMKVVEKLASKSHNKCEVPVYTVHENFITTCLYSAEVPRIYTKVFMEMGPPLGIINDLILKNLSRKTTQHSRHTQAV